VGLGPLAQLSPPGWLSKTGSGLGRSNRPSQAPLPHPSLLPALRLLRRLNHLAVARQFRLPPADSAATTLGELLPAAPSSSSIEQIRWPLPLRGDLWLDLTREIASLLPPNSHLAGSPH
jgi:hypothetical protein